MNVTALKWVRLGLGLVAGGAFVGCAGDGTATTEPAAKPPAASQSLGGFQEKKGQILYSTVKNEHLIQFFEMAPGVDAVLESGALDSKPTVGPIGNRTLSEVYRSIEGSDAPEAIVQADARTAAAVRNNGPDPKADAESRGPGPSFYNAGEQQWFLGAFCNGADVCVQGWDWAFTGTINGSNESFIGMVGSEGTVNATLSLDYWYSKSATWGIACGDCGSWWQEFDSVLVVPGHWYSLNVAGNFWLQGHLDGAGGGTQVSLAARR